MRRREFITTGCIACLGAGPLAALLSSCAAGDVIRVELADGRIRVPLPLPGPGPVHIVRAAGSPDEIALVNGSGGNIHALILRCTHADTPLRESGDGFSCSLHGSRFDLDGNVIRGPAPRPLRRLETAMEQGAIVIYAETRHPASR